MKSLIRFALGAAFVANLGATPAFAHAFLKLSDPPVGSTVKSAPKLLTLIYTEDLEVPFCTVTVTDSMGMDVMAGKPEAVAGHPDEMQVPLKITMPGKITVTWHALSVDTHKTQGSFSFTVAS